MRRTRRAFIDHAALFATTDQEQGEGTAPVVLLTAHAAKGLEFPHVFVVGLEQGLFPHGRSLGSAGAYEEERRLLYVALTRARHDLSLSWARVRRTFDRTVPSARSAFLDEIPAELLLGEEKHSASYG